jgi:hypothetical protein
VIERCLDNHQYNVYTGDHPDIAQSIFSLAVSYERLKEKGNAVKLFHKALKMRQRFYGDNHPDVTETKNFFKKFFFNLFFFDEFILIKLYFPFFSHFINNQL